MKKIILGCFITLVFLALVIPREYINLAKFLRYNQLSEGCLSDEEERKMKMKNVSMEEQDAIARKAFTCIKNKQNFVERTLIPVPEEWFVAPAESR